MFNTIEKIYEDYKYLKRDIRAPLIINLIPILMLIIITALLFVMAKVFVSESEIAICLALVSAILIVYSKWYRQWENQVSLEKTKKLYELFDTKYLTNLDILIKQAKYVNDKSNNENLILVLAFLAILIPVNAFIWGPVYTSWINSSDFTKGIPWPSLTSFITIFLSFVYYLVFRYKKAKRGSFISFIEALQEMKLIYKLNKSH